ncbi:hypothetical protein SAMN05421810_102416 [Amycolatopsis arida]|uniref:Tryptophan-associated transmembrane protein (Trp_oprn_chp) n=1 Tax=Amycolatopsis arida TaxID=587909 RepID=A0A1I5PWY2_9PSEU|nr:hypothetical protein [Amycolatopsis arida]TDX98623.1 hypothetical protein CLV69_101416 [Amycolatopsis arida]SFP38131.1 hypothetical protein SAMN05421810_102416 [Amycolatopsis arida]
MNHPPPPAGWPAYRGRPPGAGVATTAGALALAVGALLTLRGADLLGSDAADWILGDARPHAYPILLGCGYALVAAALVGGGAALLAGRAGARWVVVASGAVVTVLNLVGIVVLLADGPGIFPLSLPGAELAEYFERPEAWVFGTLLAIVAALAVAMVVAAASPATVRWCAARRRPPAGPPPGGFPSGGQSWGHPPQGQHWGHWPPAGHGHPPPGAPPPRRW